jgi:hypothetical protein
VLHHPIGAAKTKRAPDWGALGTTTYDRSFGSTPLEAGAEALEEDGDDTGDQSKAIKASSHFH